MEEYRVLNTSLWKGRRVLLTGHTGFKGSWLTLMLNRLGAKVSGLSLQPLGKPNLFDTLSIKPEINHIECDIRDYNNFQKAVSEAQPEIVIHMAAQALVLEGYENPVQTISTNVMGTVNLLEILRTTTSVKTILVITSDKVYENQESQSSFTESDALGGHDPYSASKAAAEVLTSAYYRSFFADLKIPVVTARSGNVIGGGDWSPDRIIPDLWRAYISDKSVHLRDPNAVRPWQHVLDPNYGYLLYIQHCLISKENTPSSLNFGPPPKPVRNVQQVAEQFENILESKNLWTSDPSQHYLHESHYLSIDGSRALKTLGWSTSLPVDEAIKWTCDWYKAFHAGANMHSVTEAQIEQYLERV